MREALSTRAEWQLQGVNFADLATRDRNSEQRYDLRLREKCASFNDFFAVLCFFKVDVKQ